MKTATCLLAALGLLCACRRATPEPSASPSTASAAEVARAAKEQFEKGNYDESEALYAEAFRLTPDAPDLALNLGIARYRAGKFKLAGEAFKMALTMVPEDDTAHTMLGMASYSLGEFDDAVNQLNKALAINPKNAAAHNYLGLTATRKGWAEAAQKELETAKALEPAFGDSLPHRDPIGDFMTPLERSRMRIPTGKYEPLAPPIPAPVPR